MVRYASHFALFLTVAIALAAFKDTAAADRRVPNADERWLPSNAADVPEFGRHVVPLLGKLGCNNRACHGSFQGQNGFRLSLFGHDAKMDFDELTTDEGDGPRVNVDEPEKSLALLKPTGDEEHDGGNRMAKDSWQYRLLRAWVAGGAKFDAKSKSHLVRVDISPAEIQFAKSGQTNCRLRLTAHFSDGTQEDVTALTLFSSNDDAVAKVDEAGLVSMSGMGDTAIVATYAGTVVTSQVIVPRDAAGELPPYPANNPIDDLAAAKWRKLGIHPAELSTDAEFLRRVYLDLIGTLPTTDEARQFLGDGSPDRRTRLIDSLLARPEYALYWATKFSDWTGNDSRFTPQPRSKTAWLWYDWLRDKLARNVAYDELVGGFLTATSREGRSAEAYLAEHEKITKNLAKGFDDGTYAQRTTNDMYWRKATNGNAQTLMLQSTYAFLGIRMECAQCHKHPFDRWTQDDFQQFTAFFSTVSRGVQDDLKDSLPKQKNNKDYNLQEVYIAAGGVNAKKANEKEPIKARLLGAGEVAFSPGEDPRVALWQWMRSAENPQMAKAIANRLWGHYFGTGIVQPVDDFNAANPPSNPQLLDWLARDFIEHGYDLKHLHRTILTSRTYQLSWQPNDTNRLDTRNFSHATLRRMPAEVLLDAINQITGTTDQYSPTDAPAGTRAIGLAPSRLRGNGPEYALSIFGRPLRTQTCDCERSGETGLAQAMYLLNDVELNTKIAGPEGILAKLVQQTPDDAKLVEELFLRALSRYPQPAEMEKALAFVAHSQDRQAGAQDVLWSLLNVREFIFIH